MIELETLFSGTTTTTTKDQQGAGKQRLTWCDGTTA